MKITAAEAKQLMESDHIKQVEAVYPLIKDAAESGKRGIRLGGSFWSRPSSNEWYLASKLLKRNGYTVDLYVIEQGLDHTIQGTEITWA